MRHTEETKQKIREARLGQKLSETHKANIAAGIRRAYTENPSLRVKASQSHSGKSHSWCWNRGLTKDTDKRIANTAHISSERRKADWQNPEYRAKVSLAVRASLNNPDMRRRRSETSKKVSARPETKQRRRELALKRWANPVFREKISGSNANNWRGGASFEVYPESFYRLRDAILARDGYKCTLCHVSQESYFQKLSVHHVDYNKKNCNISNLVTLCRHCNSKVNWNREHWVSLLTPLIVEYVPEEDYMRELEP